MWAVLIQFVVILGAISAVFVAGLKYERLQCATEMAEITAATNRARIEAEHEKSQTESQLRAIKYRIEAENADTQVKIDQLLADNRRLAASHGMRDPGRKAASPKPVSSDTRPAQECAGTESADQLSAEASDFLLAFAADADATAAQLSSCQQWVSKVIGVSHVPNRLVTK